MTALIPLYLRKFIHNGETLREQVLILKNAVNHAGPNPRFDIAGDSITPESSLDLYLQLYTILVNCMALVYARHRALISVR